jgi:hypothetical protein
MNESTLELAHRLSLVQRNHEAAQVALDSAAELLRVVIQQIDVQPVSNGRVEKVSLTETAAARIGRILDVPAKKPHGRPRADGSQSNNAQLIPLSPKQRINTDDGKRFPYPWLIDEMIKSGVEEITWKALVEFAAGKGYKAKKLPAMSALSNKRQTGHLGGGGFGGVYTPVK